MYKRSLIVLFSLFAWVCPVAMAQNNVIVNPATGTANVAIPIYTIKKGAVNIPVMLYYSASGVKVKDVEGNAGMNWQLVAGGQITRQVRGLPDDCESDSYSQPRLGWLYNTNATKITNFTISNTTNSCATEATDSTTIHNNFSDLSDTEPDIFHINAPGLSCEFVFDGSHNIRTIPYEDLKITYTTDATGQINSFTVINDMGVQYLFTQTEKTLRQTVAASASSVNFFKTDYRQYKNGIQYNAAWDLTAMGDSNGNSVAFSYISGQNIYSQTPLNLIIGGTGSSTSTAYQYTVSETLITPHYLSEIACAGDTSRVDFSYIPGVQSMMVQSIKYPGNTASLMYSILSSYSDGYNRSFLKYLIDGPNNYAFNYVGDTPANTTILPDSTTKQIDYWGYYSNVTANTSLIPAVYINTSTSPSTILLQRYKIQASATPGTPYASSLPGAVRTVDPSYVMNGALNKITYNSSGTTTLVYEPNDFYDPSASVVVQGGGIRVKQIVDYDGIDATKNIIRNYTYLDPSTGLSSGRPVTLPAYAFTISNSSGQWNSSTVRSENDLSQDDESILYSNVKLTQTGAGSTLYQYTIPATNWDVTVSPDWNVTVDNIANANCSVPGYTKNHIGAYPFAPNTNYNFERGLLTKTINYNDANQEVSETNYTYQRSTAPLIIPALKFDYAYNDMSYAKYSIYAYCSELLTQVTKKVFDSSTLSQQQSSTVNYAYNSAQHKHPTLITVGNSDNSSQIEKITYTKDFIIPAGTTDLNLLAMQGLQQLNVNIPVETQSQVSRGGIAKTTGSQLTTYKTFSGTQGPYYLLVQKFSFIAPDGVTDFTPASVNGGSFNKDLRYVTVENDTSYDNVGYLLSKDDNYRHIQTVLTDHTIGLPRAIVTNAEWNELVYSSFESARGSNGILVNGVAGTFTFSNTSRSGNKAWSLNAGATLTASLHKNAQAQNYIFSCWINPSATGGNLTFNVQSNGGSVAYSIPVTNNPGTWKYYEISIPTLHLASGFSISLQNNIAVIIDDFLFLPDVANIKMYTYDPASRNKLSETDGNGITTYYTYDKYGRLNDILDQDKNIVQHNNYGQYSGTQSYIVPGFSTNTYSLNITGRTYTFTNTSFVDPSVTDLVYTWDYGDGSTATGTNGSHIYTNPGTYTVTLKATSAVYGQFIYTSTITIASPPAATVKVNVTNLSSGGTIFSIDFMQAGQIIYHFKGMFFNNGPEYIIPDKYDIVVTTTGTASNFHSLTYSGSQRTCVANSGTVYDFSDQYSTNQSVNVKLDVVTCTGTTSEPNAP